jgi:spore coat polysaccharide biosynthesis protein SpsF
MTRLVVVIQARNGSSRLPGKVMLPLAGKPLLARMVERVRAARTPFDTVVATTVDTNDNPIVDLCRAIDVPCFRGDPLDLLDRHFRAAVAFRADAVAKIPSDCPLIDPGVIDKVCGEFLVPDIAEGRWDFVSNLHPPTYPDGNDVEVMSIGALETAWREADRDFQREHTTPFLWDQPDRFRIGNVVWETGLDYSQSHRFTIDYTEDYEFIAAVFAELQRRDGGPPFTLKDILELLRRRPELMQVNERHRGTNWYGHHAGELRTIAPLESAEP